MQHLIEFKKNVNLITKYGEGNAHLLWVMSLYLDDPDIEKLAADGLTDGSGDKKIDFITQSNSTIYITQGYYSNDIEIKISAPANKASDLNTALAWIYAGNENTVPEKLKNIIRQIREIIANNEVEEIELLYIHNCAESKNVTTELETCAKYLEQNLAGKEISV